MPAAIELRNVHKGFDRQEVLRGINLVVNDGETKIVLGPSGQGKSTILRLILGLDSPDEGEILIDGIDIANLGEEELIPVRQKMGMVFQESSLFDSLSVFDNISYRLREDKELSDEEVEGITTRLLHLVDLEQDDLVKLPAQLSGGMKRRVAMARAMAGIHHIMLYDEPTAGLDPITASHITELIIRLRDLEKVTSILVTQDLISSFAMLTQCAHKVPTGILVAPNPEHECAKNTSLVILKDGRILVEGNMRQLLESRDKYVVEFLASLKQLAAH